MSRINRLICLIIIATLVAFCGCSRRTVQEEIIICSFQQEAAEQDCKKFENPRARYEIAECKSRTEHFYYDNWMQQDAAKKACEEKYDTGQAKVEKCQDKARRKYDKCIAGIR